MEMMNNRISHISEMFHHEALVHNISGNSCNCIDHVQQVGEGDSLNGSHVFCDASGSECTMRWGAYL